VSGLQIFAIRAILGIAFAVLLIRFFYPDATAFHVGGLAVVMVGLAYVFEYFRKRKSE
jgi:uncharacterized membrane protein